MSGDNHSENRKMSDNAEKTVPLGCSAGDGDSPIDNQKTLINNNKELSDTESMTNPPDIVPQSGKVSPVFSDAGSVRSSISTISKASGIRAPTTRIGRPCCKGAPKPAVPSATPSRQDSNEYYDMQNNNKVESYKDLSRATKPRTTSVSSNCSLDTLWELYPQRLIEAGLRRSSDANVVLTADTASFIIGDRIWVGGTKPGQIAYIGETQFGPGEWAGIVLDEPIGKNDGSLSGIRYFQCEPKRGIFSRLTRLTREPLPQTQDYITEHDGAQVTPTKAYQSSRASRVTTPTPSIKSSLSHSRGLNTSTTSLASNVTSHGSDLRIGERVIVRSSATTGSKAGVLRFIGKTAFQPGEWCGVELDDPIGKNDGSVDGVRYFECQPCYGLFALSSKVSRSPSSRRPSQCVMHPRPGSTTPLRRSDSRESLTSSIASSVRTTSSRVRLGVTSLHGNVSKNVLSNNIAKATHSTTPLSSRVALQDALRDKEAQISKLKRERELDRAEVTRAATQIDRAEQMLASLKQNYETLRSECELKLKEKDGTVCSLEKEKANLLSQIDEERRRAEDLQFKFEEAAITHSDVEVTNKTYLTRIKELEQKLEDEMKRVEALEHDSNKLFEAEEELGKVRDELDLLKQQHSDDKDKATSELIASLKKQLAEAQVQTETNAPRITEFEKLLHQNKMELDSITQKFHETESLYKKSLETISTQAVEIESLKLKLDETITEKDTLKSKLETANADIVKKTEDLCENAKKRELELTTEFEKLNELVKNKNETIDRYIEQLKEKDRELVDVKVKLDTIEHELKLKDEHIDNHVRAKREAEAQFDSQLQEQQLRWQLANAEFEKQKMETAKQLAAAQAEAIAKQSQLEVHLGTIKQLNLGLNQAKDNAAAQVTSHIENQNKFIQQKEEKIFELNQQFELKCHELASCHDTNNKQVQEIHQQAAQIATYKRDFEELFAKLKAEENLNCNLTAKINELELQIGDTTRQLTVASEHISVLSIQNNDLKIEINKLVALGSDSDGKLAECSNKYQEVMQQIEVTRTEYIKTIQLEQNRVQQFEQQVNGLRQQMADEGARFNKQLSDERNAKAVLEQQCKDAVQNRESERQRLETLLNQHVASYKQLQDERSKVEHQLQIEIANCQGEKVKQQQEFEAQIVMYQQSNSQLQLEKSELQTLVQQKSDIIIELESKCKSLFQNCQEQCSKMKQECTASIQKCADDVANLRSTLQSRDQQINELSIQLTTISQERASCDATLNKRNQNLENLNIELQQIRNQLQLKDQEILAKSNDLNVASQNLADLQSKLQQCDGTIQDYQNKLEAANRDLSGLHEQLVLNQRHCSNKDQQIQELGDLRQQYENEKQVILMNCNQKEQKINELLMTIEVTKQQQCVKCEGKFDQFKKDAQKLSDSCAQKDNDIMNLKQKLDTMGIECSRVAAEINLWKAEYEKVKNDSMAIDQRCAQKDQEIINLRNDIQLLAQQKDQEANHRINLLEQQINNYKLQYDAYQRQCQQKDQQLAGLQQQVIDLHKEGCAKPDNQFHGLKQQCDELRNSYTNLQQDCARKTLEINQLRQQADTNNRNCADSQNKFILMDKQCEGIKTQYENLEKQCQNNLKQLSQCENQLSQKLPTKLSDQLNPSEGCQDRIVYVPTPCPEAKCQESGSQVSCQPLLIKAIQDQSRICEAEVRNEVARVSNQLQNCDRKNHEIQQELNKQRDITVDLEMSLVKCNKLESELKQVRLQDKNKIDNLINQLQQKDQQIVNLNILLSQQNPDARFNVLKNENLDYLNRIAQLEQLLQRKDNCQVLELQLQQKDMEIQSQAKIIEELRRGLHTGKPDDNILLQQLQVALMEKDKLIMKLKSDLMGCSDKGKTMKALSDAVGSPCNNDENNKLRAELHWQKVRTIEFETKYQLLVKENQAMFLRLQDAAARCGAKGDSTLAVGDNWQLEKLTLLEQIAELKCELEERAKELIVCKTKIPCLQSKIPDLSEALEKAHLEKFAGLQSVASSVDTAAMVGNGVSTALAESGGPQLDAEFQKAQSQIQFLNTIIVDMQQKNELLRTKIEALEAGCGGSSPLESFVRTFHRRL